MGAFRRAATAGCISALALGGFAGAAGAESLGDAIALAYQTNPTLQAERAQLRATDEEYPQAASALRPTVGASAAYTYTDASVTETGSPNIKLTGGGEQGGLQITQPLYTGGRASAQIDAAHADILAERENLRRTEESVLQSVIDAYLDVRRDQQQLVISQDNVNVLARQLEETSARFDAGQLTRTDVAQSQARLALARSQLAAAASTLAVARAGYAAVVGQNPGELAPEPPIAPLLPATVDAAFDAAERDNPQLRQADDAEQAAAARLAETKAALRPNVSVSGQYGYVSQQEGVSSAGSFNQSVGLFESQLGGSVTATVNVPIYNGGLYASQIRQAAERDNVARIGVESARRQVLQAVSQAWNQLLGARASLAADEEQVKSDTVAFEGVREEQKVGLRTILDVLNAQQELETSQIQLVGARHDEYVAAAAVLAATGALEAKALIPDQARYDPDANFDRIRRDHAVPWEGAVHAIDHLGAPEPTPMPPPSAPGEVVKTATP